MNNDFIKNIFGLYMKEISDGVKVEREVGLLSPKTEKAIKDSFSVLKNDNDFWDDLEDHGYSYRKEIDEGTWGDDSYWDDKACVRPACDTCLPTKVNYTARLFIDYIMSLGDYRAVLETLWTEEDMKQAVRDKLNDIIPNSYFIVRPEGKQIALAAPMYIPNAKVTAAKALGIVPEVFTEVSGPGSTVLIIDCEKEFLKKKYFEIGDNEWLL